MRYNSNYDREGPCTHGTYSFFFPPPQKTDLGKLMANQYQSSLDHTLAFESYGLRVLSH